MRGRKGRHDITPVALVTGSFSRVADLELALKQAGFSVTELVAPGVRVFIVDDEGPPDDIAGIGRHREPDQARRISEYAALQEGWSFTDWRTEVLSRWRSPDI